MSLQEANAAVVAADKNTVQPANASVTQQDGHAEGQKTTATVVEVPGKGKGGFSAKPELGELVEFQLTGLLVVFTVLGGITLVCNLISLILKTIAPDQYHCRSNAPVVQAKPVAAPAHAAVSTVAHTIHPGLADEKLVAILSAAAHEALGRPVSVVSFRPVDGMDRTWTVQGRVGLHTSHSL